MNKYQQKHIITLSEPQRLQLQNITKKGKHNARVIKRAQVLLESAAGVKDADITRSLEVSKRTVEYIRERFCDGSLDRALFDAPRPGQPRKIDDKTEAHLIAVACSTPPEGYDHWTLELLKKRLGKDKKKHVSTVTIWHHLHDLDLKPWREKNVVHSGG